MKHIKSTILLLFLVLLAGCIKEDRDDCGKTTLRFSYVGNGTTEIFHEKIRQVDLYVFDANNQCILTHTLEQNEMKSQSKQMVLNPGTYRVVCIGNALHETVTPGIHSGDFNEMHCTHPNCNSEKKITTFDALYHASQEITVPKSRELEAIIPFTAAHYDVCVEVKGYTPAQVRADQAPVLKFAQVSQKVNFNKNYSTVLTDIHPIAVYENNLYRHTFNILRQVEKPVITLYDNVGKSIFSMNLTDFLAQHPEIDLTLEELLIPILIEFKSVGVEVSIPSWAIEDLTPDFNN